MGKLLSVLRASAKRGRDSCKSKEREVETTVPEIRIIGDEEFQKMRLNARKRSIQDLLQDNYHDEPELKTHSPTSRARKWSLNLLRRLSGSSYSNEDIPNITSVLSISEMQKAQSQVPIPQIVVDSTTFTRKNSRRRVIRRNDGFRKAFRTNNVALKEARAAVQSTYEGYDSE